MSLLIHSKESITPVDQRPRCYYYWQTKTQGVKQNIKFYLIRTYSITNIVSLNSFMKINNIQQYQKLLQTDVVDVAHKN